MAHPKKRRTTSDKGRRRSHHALSGVATSICKKCGSVVKPHNVCAACGFYGNKEILGSKVKETVEEKKASTTEVKKTSESKKTEAKATTKAKTEKKAATKSVKTEAKNEKKKTEVKKEKDNK